MGFKDVIEVRKLRYSITQNIIKIAYPLILSLFSYPFFAAVILALVLRFFPSESSIFVFAMALYQVFLKTFEALLSGTRVLITYEIHAPSLIRKDILAQAIISLFLMSLVTLSFLSITFYTLLFFHIGIFSSHIAYIFLLVFLGLPGTLLYSVCSYYAHAHKKTQGLPFISWFSNVAGAFGILAAALSGFSFYTALFILFLSRYMLGVLAFAMIDPDLRPSILEISKKFNISNISIVYKIFNIGIPQAIYSLLFTGSFFVFALIIEVRQPGELSTFQIEINILNLMAVSNMALISSGCVMMNHVTKNQDKIKNLIFQQNMMINLGVMLFLSVVVWIIHVHLILLLGGSPQSVFLFEKTYALLVFIYGIDQIQTLLIQTMIYSKDQFYPPFLSILSFAGIAIPMAFFYNTSLGLTGVLVAILLGTLFSSCVIFMRFRIKHLNAHVHVK